ncbi:MAG: PaaI family thioesterase [Bacteroidales bacterium]|nr:PaaI family thioesterase [Bacteroidales bacterium]
MTNLTHKAQQVFARDRYATELTEVSIDLVESRHACCSLTLLPLHRNAMGAVMGGVMFTLADLAFAAAANSDLIADDLPLAWVSLGSEIHYLAQPKGSHLLAETQCIRQGRTTCVYIINIHDELSTPIALVTTTGMKSN